MRLTTGLLWILVIGFVFQTPAQQTGNQGKERPQIEFYVAGRFQAAPKYRVRSFRLAGSNSPELASHFRGLAGLGFERGEYIYDLAPENPPSGPSGIFDLAGRVWLNGSDSDWITLQMPVGTAAEGAIFTLAGRVLPPPGGGNDPVWIRFQHAVDHSQVAQSKLATDGTFRIPIATPFTGSVVVTVCRGNDVLFLDVVHFSGGQPGRPLEFRIGKNAL